MTEILIPVLVVAIIGLIAGVGLALASKYMAVPTDEKEEKLREALPGANCGACGFSGCDGYAASLAKGEVAPDKCAPGGNATVQALSEILGVESGEITPMTAHIHCGGNPEISTTKYDYLGMQSCTAANIIHQGPLSCSFGCLGFGDCVRACSFGAITINNGRPIICEDLCIACGKCVGACPKSLISIIPKGAAIHVECANKARGAAVAKACKVACLACTQCETNCPNGAIKVVDNCAVIDYSLCNGCGKCKEVCKRGVLI